MLLTSPFNKDLDMKDYDLYLFDFDGTLIDTMGALEYVFTVSYEHVGMVFDPSKTVLFSRILLSEGYRIMGGDPDKFPEFAAYIEKSLDFPQALEDNEIYPETIEVLKELKRRNKMCGIVTSNKIKHVKEVLKKFDIPEEYFEVYIGNKEYTKFKPDPDPIIQALKQANYKGDLSKVVYVGDGMNDALCAKNAHVDSVVVDRLNHHEESLDYVRITNLKELL